MTGTPVLHSFKGSNKISIFFLIGFDGEFNKLTQL